MACVALCLSLSKETDMIIFVYVKKGRYIFKPFSPLIGSISKTIIYLKLKCVLLKLLCHYLFLFAINIGTGFFML